MLYFRVDMNQKIAMGHLMRCLSIAYAAKIQGEECTFILADIQAVELIRERGFRYIVLESQWDNMESELSIILKVIEEEKIQCLLIDSYYVTEKYLKELSKRVFTIYLDDLNTFHYPVNAILCYESYYADFEYEKNYPETELLLGVQYMPLRPEFGKCQVKEILPKAERLLLMSGGSDEFDILSRILSKLDIKKYTEIYVICGMFYEKFDWLSRCYAQYDSIKIRKAVSNLKDYMDAADIAVTAAGTSLYELSAVGTPAVTYILADNQLNNALQFDKDGIAKYAGDIRRDDIVTNIVNFLDKYTEDYEYRKICSTNMQKYVDGKGATRIIEKIKSYKESLLK